MFAALPEHRHADQVDQNAIVERKDAQRPANVVGAVVIGALARVEQDSGDQKAAQDEEGVHRDPGQLTQVPDAGRQRLRPEVVEEHHRRPDGTQTIQLLDVTPKEWS